MIEEIESEDGRFGSCWEFSHCSRVFPSHDRRITRQMINAGSEPLVGLLPFGALGFFRVCPNFHLNKKYLMI